MLYAAGSVCDVSVRADNLCGLTWFGEFLWYADGAAERVVGIDPCTGEAVQTIHCPGLSAGLATMGGNLVYASGPRYQLVLVDPASGESVAEIRNPRPAERVCAMEGGRNGLWLGYHGYLDLRTMTDFSLITCVGVPGEVSGIAVTDRYLVYADRQTESIVIVDPVIERAVLHINIHGKPTGLAWDGSRIWYCDSAASRLRAVDVPGIVRPR